MQADRQSNAAMSLTGMTLLDNPSLNRSTAFTQEERSALGLNGLLPPVVETLDQQVTRAYEAFEQKDTDLERNIYLRQLQDSNETLFYRLLLDRVEEMTPIVYTPTVGLACQQFSHIYRRPRGLFISYPQRDKIAEILRNRPHQDVAVTVVTDGERILGLGDQGVGGMGIPIGKLSLYSLIGGIPPERTLPIILDVGTNNQERLNDPEYLGWRHERITGDEYLDFVDLFVQAAIQEFPETYLLQWEDFAGKHARPLLEKYRDKLLTFNDDIQGTAAVALSCAIAGMKVGGKKLGDQDIVFFGAGSAAIGVADYLLAEMKANGLSEQDARSKFFFVNSKGILHTGRKDLNSEQQGYAQPEEKVKDWPKTDKGNTGLADVIGQVNAGALIGLSTVGGAFTEAIVREMARKTDRPLIFPLSNPTVNSEAKADDLIRWTDGRAIVASGSPFAPVEFNGKKMTIAQCNNVFIFPAVGLGVMAARARRVTDAMMIAASRALSEHSPVIQDETAALLPPIHSLRDIARDIAFAVGREAQNAGVAPAGGSADEFRQQIADAQWSPAYPDPAQYGSVSFA
jgi:malate dehydrogenase (oxaloacetate-decarboxylating)